MKTLRNTRSLAKSGRGRARGIVWVTIALSVPLAAVMALTGCDVAYDLGTTTSLSTAAADSTSTTAEEVTTTTSLDASTTVTSGTTTTALTTSTTVAGTTTTVVASSATSTTLADTSTTTTTVPSTTPDQTEEIEGTVLYAIDDWSEGYSGWAAAGQWKTVDGMLVTDGTSDSFAVAPVDLTGYPDYVVECEIQLLDPEAGTVAALLARLINGTAYYGGFDGANHQMVVGYATDELGNAGFILDSNWHKYRLEVRGNDLKLYLEQAEVARATDNRILEPGTVGIYCAHGQINVRSFRVVAL